ncbi:hypothetical protein C8J56DRAFT_1059269 [Mycena floridula]|nr:hypothetical protein C8J56DRAFT_1059269 [Mycena floridula]
MSAPTAPTLPPVRRVITGHTVEGKSTVIKDEVQQHVVWRPGGAPVYDLGWADTVPVKIDSELTEGGYVDEISKHDKVLVSENGASFRVFDHAPGMVVPFHRTLSMDYGIVTKGQVVLVLDNDERIVLKEGDIVVQRGTIHSWRNETDEWARIYFVVLGAQPIKIGGKELEIGFFE